MKYRFPIILITILFLSCKSKQQKSLIIDNHDDIQQLLVNLDNQIHLDDWIAKYSEYNLIIDRVLSKDEQIYLIKQNTSKISNTEFKKILLNDKNVESVDENKQSVLR